MIVLTVGELVKGSLQGPVLIAPHRQDCLVARGDVHHVEIWVPSLSRSIASVGWLLESLGYEAFQSWEHGRSWRLGGTYLVIEQSPALTAQVYDRLHPGLNHLAFHCGTRDECDRLVVESQDHGWMLLFPELHPNAGGPDHYAGFIADIDGFEIELVAAVPLEVHGAVR